jgi:NTP pyrophosphatase (non-canonical NTP hydrolase)
MGKDDSLKQIKQFIKDRDWEKFHDPKNLAISLNLETAEVLELFQWTNDNNINPEKKESLNDELADVYYWLLLLAEYYKIDLDISLQNKLKKNAENYPINKSSGNSKKYTDL